MGLIANTGLSDLKVLIPGPLVATPEWLYPVVTQIVQWVVNASH